MESSPSLQFPCSVIADVPLQVFMKFNKIKKNVESVECIAKALSNSDFLKLSDDRTTVCRVTPIAETRNVDERTIYVVSRCSLNCLFPVHGGVWH